ncbi:MAG TPA: hypothetical protein VMU81_05905 [Acetobacteraceae bacterium]|jgi:hypothetical protein|nr:hypothetical protein [Acetobacteraceae bacterium]
MLASVFPGLEALPEREREDGVMVRYRLPPAYSVASPARALHPALLVFPRYLQGSAAALPQLTPAGPLGRLLAGCQPSLRHPSIEAVAGIMPTMEQASCRELVMGDLLDSARHVMKLAEDTCVRAGHLFGNIFGLNS